MTSGIGDFLGDRYRDTPREQLRSINDFLPLFADKPLEFAPETRRRYSNGGFVVLGAIIEKASGTDYYAYIREHVYKPAGMLDSDSFEKDRPVSRRAKGYTRQDGTAAGVRKENYQPSLPGEVLQAAGTPLPQTSSSSQWHLKREHFLCRSPLPPAGSASPVVLPDSMPPSTGTHNETLRLSCFPTTIRPAQNELRARSESGSPGEQCSSHVSNAEKSFNGHRPSDAHPTHSGDHTATAILESALP